MAVKFGARLIRALVYGLVLGPMLFMMAYFLGTAVNNVAGTTLLNTTGIALGMFGIGLAAPIAIEISKDIEQEQKQQG